MTSKKTVRKVTTKKVTKSKAATTRPRVVSATPVSELFTTRPENEGTIQVPTDSVSLWVNGRDKGITNTGGQTLASFVKGHANRQGITSFAVYVDGVKVDTGEGNKLMTGMRKVELVTKDSRG